MTATGIVEPQLMKPIIPAPPTMYHHLQNPQAVPVTSNEAKAVSIANVRAIAGGTVDTVGGRRIRTPHAHDVLCGRGGGINSHPGNRTFRDWVRERKHSYNLASSKAQKARVSREIVTRVRSLDPPGRFLTREDRSITTLGAGSSCWWIEIDDTKAMAKTSQALREGAPSIRAAHSKAQAAPETDPQAQTKPQTAPAKKSARTPAPAPPKRKERENANPTGGQSSATQPSSTVAPAPSNTHAAPKRVRSESLAPGTSSTVSGIPPPPLVSTLGSGSTNLLVLPGPPPSKMRKIAAGGAIGLSKVSHQHLQPKPTLTYEQSTAPTPPPPDVSTTKNVTERQNATPSLLPVPMSPSVISTPNINAYPPTPLNFLPGMSPSGQFSVAASEPSLALMYGPAGPLTPTGNITPLIKSKPTIVQPGKERNKIASKLIHRTHSLALSDIGHFEANPEEEFKDPFEDEEKMIAVQIQSKASFQNKQHTASQGEQEDQKEQQLPQARTEEDTRDLGRNDKSQRQGKETEDSSTSKKETLSQPQQSTGEELCESTGASHSDQSIHRANSLFSSKNGYGASSGPLGLGAQSGFLNVSRSFLSDLSGLQDFAPHVGPPMDFDEGMKAVLDAATPGLTSPRGGDDITTHLQPFENRTPTVFRPNVRLGVRRLSAKEIVKARAASKSPHTIGLGRASITNTRNFVPGPSQQ